jgi:hypothetical protein
MSNSVRELSKIADGATESDFKALPHTVKYVIDTETWFFLQLKYYIFYFYLVEISNSEYTGDLHTCISVYGYVLYFCGAHIAWKSKAGKSVNFSST